MKKGIVFTNMGKIEGNNDNKDPARTLHLSHTVSKLNDMKFKDWNLKTDLSLGGDSISYLDRVEQNNIEENRRVRERQIMEEGK